MAGKVDVADAWNGKIKEVQPWSTIQQAFERAKESAETSRYQDVHVNVFTPASFLNVLEVASKLDLFDFVITDFYDTVHNTLEFFVSLKRLPDNLSLDEKLTKQLASITWARNRICTH